MVRKVWVCFDEHDNIIEVCNEVDKVSCNVKNCEQYVMKLIPIYRDESEIEKRLNDFEKSASDLDRVMDGFEKSADELRKSLKRFRI